MKKGTTILVTLLVVFAIGFAVVQHGMNIPGEETIAEKDRPKEWSEMTPEERDSVVRHRDSILRAKKEERSNSADYQHNEELKKQAFTRLKSLRSEDSQSQDVTFYYYPSLPKFINQDAFYIYFGINASNYTTPLRLRLQYTSQDWLFIEGFRIFVDNQIDEYIEQKFERDSKNEIWEWADIIINKELLTILEKVSESKETKIRYVGYDSFKEIILTEKEKKAIGEMIKLHAALNLNT